MAASGNYVNETKTGSQTDEAESLSAANYKKKKRRPWLVVLIIALVVLAVALGVLAFIGYTYWSGQQAYDDIAEEVFVAPVEGENPENAPEDLDLSGFYIDWDALRAINPDVVGWIYVPGTVINYPVAHVDGDDEYYLHHNFSRSSSGQFGAEYGCIQLSGVNNADFSDRVNVIYGHNMANGSMFAALSFFYDSSRFNAHRTFYLFTPTGYYKLRSFAVNHVLGSDTSIVIPNFVDDAEFEAYVQARLDNSIVRADQPVATAESVSKVFAFSTCDGSDNTYRYITFCSIEEYLPIDANLSQDFISEGNAEEVENTTGERVS